MSSESSSADVLPKSCFHGLKVVLIDDSKTIRQSAKAILAGAGCSVVTASDGFESLSKIVEHQPDVILVDITMPRLDGFQTCALVKQNSRFRDIPVIMLTSKDGLFDRARSKLVGAEHYVTKPFSREELLEALRCCVEPCGMGRKGGEQ
ncbi:MAG TPA: response regulator [Gammaproteobacteria bacterium]|nr:response regulator [Gammaproteobacteria bacterium]